MKEIKRFNCTCSNPLAVKYFADGPYLLASDIDADALEAAIESLGVELLALETAALNSTEPYSCSTLDKHAQKNKQHITHLSALLAAVRKQ